MYILSKELFYPPVSNANLDGILAIGDDLSLGCLILQYQSGLFTAIYIFL